MEEQHSTDERYEPLNLVTWVGQKMELIWDKEVGMVLLPLLTLHSRRGKLQFGLNETRQNMSGDFNFSFQLVSTGVFWKGCPVLYKHMLSTLLSGKQL